MPHGDRGAYRPERPPASQDVPRGGRADRADSDEARWHRQGRHRDPHLSGARRPDQAGRRGRADRGSAALRSEDLRGCDRGRLMSDDQALMAQALDLALRGRGLTSPNPVVGALVVEAGTVVGQGYHRRAGEAHAEVLALAEAGTRARGATLYVTLEPCNHHGRTPPCVEAVLATGIRRVVIATPDPNPQVRGGGAAALRAAGVEVTVGCLEAEARGDNRAYITAMERRRPHVTLKWAMTLDGKIAAFDRSARWITGPAAREEAH